MHSQGCRRAAHLDSGSDVNGFLQRTAVPAEHYTACHCGTLVTDPDLLTLRQTTESYLVRLNSHNADAMSKGAACRTSTRSRGQTGK